ncbi:MAG: prepilin-type N-terminal cleavage/methylation domain-containing protein [Candidatus Marinimicrobia bacterium]|nr:prepilin-type N-terminal cleavage/methylation domain-containing protein [Candidatus Neomarinimicrobiota bacterium]
MSARRSRQATRHGFTLVELLVVIAIIGILIALLFPALSGVRATARAVTCRSRQRSLLVGISAFTADHRYYPPFASTSKDPSAVRYHKLYGLYGTGGNYNSWFGMLTPYMGMDVGQINVHRFNRMQQAAYEWHFCPVNLSVTPQRRDYIAYNNFFGMAYNTTPKSAHLENYRHVTAEHVTWPSLTAIFTDMNYDLAGDANSYHWGAYRGPDFTHHGTGANYGFADGHVTMMEAAEAQEEFFAPTPNYFKYPY